MDSRTQERVERWDSRPFSDGFDGLSELAQNGFSGAVRAADTWLFMLNGRVVGVIDGRIEAFEDATGTTYVAPDPALPLLCSMEEDGGEARAKYYTNKTPLEEVDETLSSGSFTGYVELSERVLSGDYYLVYYGGRRMAAAYIGNAERLLTDDEAFERAADEVGIYEVYDVDVEVTDVPDASEPEPEPEPEPESPSTSPTETPTGATPTDSPSDPNAAEDASLEGQPSEKAGRPSNRERNSEPAGQRETPRGEEQVSPTADADAREETAEEPSPSTSPPQEPPTDPSPEVEDEGSRSDDEPDGITTTDDHPGASNPPGITDNTPDSVVDDAESNTATTGTGSRSAHSLDPDDLEAAARELGESDLPWATGETSSDPDESAPADADVSPNEVDAVDEEPPEDADETISLDIDTDTEGESEDEGEDEAETADDTEESAEQLEERFKQEEQWRETRSIPSLDPDNSSEQLTSARSRSAPRQTQTHDSAPESKATSQTQTDRTDDATAHSKTPSQHETADRRSHESAQTQPPTREALESDMLEREDKIDQLTQRLDNLHAHREDLEAQTEDLEAERDELRAENRELTGQVEQLQARIDDLEDELERVRSVDAAGVATESAGVAGAQLSPTEALSGTNIFIRYGSKSNPTLRTAHEGEADASAVGSNLRLEHHTQFDDTNAAVDGQSYEEFLRGTIEYQFVDWLTGTLLYEIRDTDHANSLSDLYDVIPRIDRAELHASISLADDDTEDVPDQVTFDVVAFDKRGTPLVVANLNDSRDPATREMLVEIEEASSAVNANHPDLGAAMVVTSSFFDPGALEVTEQATSGGFLSRGSKQSYVNLSRKQGYHLCLVESRNGEFHMNVPEL